jgi:hypothetical protein
VAAISLDSPSALAPDQQNRWPRFRLRSLLIATAILAVALFGANKFLREPNDWARSRIVSILLSNASREEQLESLKPFVQLGEHISVVHRRMSQLPVETIHRLPNTTSYHAYQIKGLTLHLSCDRNGNLIGIGRHIRGQDDDTVWLHPPTRSVPRPAPIRRYQVPLSQPPTLDP